MSTCDTTEIVRARLALQNAEHWLFETAMASPTMPATYAAALESYKRASDAYRDVLLAELRRRRP